MSGTSGELPQRATWASRPCRRPSVASRPSWVFPRAAEPDVRGTHAGGRARARLGAACGQRDGGPDSGGEPPARRPRRCVAHRRDPTSLPLSPRLTKRFREHHRVRIRLQSLTSRQILHGLVHGDLDAEMTYLFNQPLPDVDTLPLWRERLWLVVDAASPFYDSDQVTWRDAATLPLGLLTPDMQHRRIVDAAFALAGARPGRVSRPTPSRRSSRTRGPACRA